MITSILLFLQLLISHLLTSQDFEALTPNLLARTIETVEGGGAIVLLLRTMSSLKQLFAMTMVSEKSYHMNNDSTNNVSCPQVRRDVTY